jgi:GNAT superfamily N-acetyltransferase
VLDTQPGVVGGTFVEPVEPERFPAFARLRLDTVTGPIWFLSKLMIDPARQGNGLGYILLDGIRADVTRRGAGAIALDCWSGNETLRAFYARAGFKLHGVFPASGYEVAVFVQSLFSP